MKKILLVPLLSVGLFACGGAEPEGLISERLDGVQQVALVDCLQYHADMIQICDEYYYNSESQHRYCLGDAMRRYRDCLAGRNVIGGEGEDAPLAKQ